jgi:hypothetical protein
MHTMQMLVTAALLNFGYEIGSHTNMDKLYLRQYYMTASMQLIPKECCQ